LKLINLALAIFLLVAGAAAQTAAPAIFFTDLTSGPNTGGESVSGSAGAYVTIYGNNFGATQGSSSVTLNGASCLRVVSWGTTWLWYQKIVVQLGSSCTSGNFVVTVGGVPSTAASVTVNGSTINQSAFTVRSGNIRCVSSGGSDSNSGSFGSCWATTQHAIQTIAAGDVAYVQSLTNSDACAQYNAALCLLSQGSSGSPKAIVAYPGATVTINTNQSYGLRTPNVSGPGPFWVIAGFHITTGGSEALSLLVANVRVVANVLACPGGNGTAACYEAESSGSSLGHQIYGNQWTQAGPSNFSSSSKTYHGLYFSSGNNHHDVGWNDIHNVIGGRGLQVYQEGVDGADIHIHDNLIHDTTLDGINLNGVNPNNGPVEVYNNVEYNVGKGPDPPDGAGIYSCVNFESNGSPTTKAKVYNNTCYSAGFPSTSNPSQSGAFSLYIPTTFENNLVYEASGRSYFTSDAGCGQVSGSNNNFFGNGGTPSCSALTSSTNVNPQIVSTSTPDFHLASGSPMIAAGTNALFPALDHDGVARANPPSIGAYEDPSGVQRPAPPTGLSVTVQ